MKKYALLMKEYALPMKRYAMVMLLLGAMLTCWAARERNYIFIFDCTQSMDGYGGAPKVWQPAKNFLKRNIERKSPESTITIVPFQGQALEPIVFKRADFNWEQVEKKLNEHIQHVTNTNIKDAWQKGNAYIDPRKNNYLVLLTDGRDQNPNALYEILNNWCGKNPNTKAYYVALTSNSDDPKIRQIINQCDDMEWVDSSLEVEDFGQLGNVKLVMPIEDIANKKTAKLAFSDEGHFKGYVIAEDPYFDVTIKGDLTAITELRVVPKSGYDINGLRQMLDDTYTMNVRVESDQINILNPDVEIEVINKPLPILTLDGLDSEETEMDEASYYPSFLGIFKASEPGRTSVELKPEFNDIAKRQGSKAMLQVVGKDGFKDFSVMYNGETAAYGKFVVSPDDTESTLTIIFDENAEDGKHFFTLKSHPSDVEIINGQNITDEPFTTSLRAMYDVDWNPWKTFLFWVMIVLVSAFLVWILVLRRLVYPPISGVNTIMVTSPYFGSCKVRGAYQVIFSPTKIKQSAMSRIFKGKIVNQANAAWVTPFVLSDGNKGLRVKANMDYVVNPYASTLAKNSQYTIEVPKTKTNINITIN